jgi:hypothetical protein
MDEDLTGSGTRPRERRLHRRVAVDCPVELGTERGSHRGTCVNLSGGGLGLRIEVWLPVGTVVTVSVELPDGKELKAAAEIVRYDDLASGTLAVRFLRLDQKALSAVHAYVASSIPPAPDAAPSKRIAG